jgi:multiple sugar transport system substrate-binding protein
MRRLVSLFLFVALLAACSGAPEQPNVTPSPPAAENPTAEAPADGDQVVISYAISDYERTVFEPLVAKFSADNPNIKVVLVPLDDLINVSEPDANYSPLAQLRRVVSGADTAPGYVAAPETLGSNLLLDLKPLMDADASFQADDFLPGSLDQYSLNGGIYLLPRYVNVQLLNYNKDLFKNAGLPEPKPGWKWNDLLGAAEQLAQKSGNKVSTYGFLDTSGGSLPLISLLQEQGIDLLGTPAQEVRLDRQEFADAITRIHSLVDSGALFRMQYREGPSTGGQPEDPAQLLRDGHVGIWGQEFMPMAASVKGGGGGQEPLSYPVGKVPYPSTLPGFFGGGSDGYIISAGTAHPAEAWKWIEFLSRQQTDQLNPGIPAPGNIPGRIPVRTSLAEQTNFWKDLDAETAEAYRWSVAHLAPPMTRTPDYTGYGGLGMALEQTFSGPNKDPRKALQEAQQQIEQQLAQVQLTPTPKPEGGPVVVATPEPQVAPEGATTIKFSSYAYSPSLLRQLARSFRDQHPEIFVEINATEVFTQAPTLRQIAQNNDCFAWNVPPQAEDFGALADLQPLFDADASFPQSDFAPALLAPYQHDGGLFGLPYAATLRTLNYNKTAFDAAGIKTPTYQWTPDDFLAAAQALTKGDGDKKQFGYVPWGGALQDMQFFVGQFGGRLTTGSGLEARPNFADPKTVEAIKWYIDLATVHKVMPPLKFQYRRDDPGFDDKTYEYVQNGRAALWFDQGLGMFGGPKGEGQPRSFEVGLAPLPIGKGGLNTGDIYLRGFHISARAEKTQSCWEWIKYMSGDIVNLQGGLPARASVLASDAFKKQSPPELLVLAETYAEALKGAGRQPTASGDPNAFYSFDTYWFFKALSEAIDKKADLAKGLAEAQEFTTGYMECMAKNPGKPATCANQVDPTYQGYSTEDPPQGPGMPIPLG